MKLYCRYCIYLCVNNVPYCDIKKKVKGESSCKRPNKCKDFVFANCEPEYQDAFGETNGYKERKPRKPKEKDCLGQMSFDLAEVQDEGCD